MQAVNIISLGAGVQSSTIALMAACGEIQPMPAAAIFADTGDETDDVYLWLDWLEKQLPFPVVRIYKGKLSEMATRVRRSAKSGMNYLKPVLPMFTLNPDGSKGMMQRQCTMTAKIEPLKSAAKKLAGKRIPIVMWIGISTDEPERIKPSRDSRITNTWPLIDLSMSRQACLDWMKRKGYPAPPRSACYYCPFHSDREWIRIKNEQPADFARAITFEKLMQSSFKQCERLTGVPFLHASRVPLSEVSFDNVQNEFHFGNECEGMCGI